MSPSEKGTASPASASSQDTASLAQDAYRFATSFSELFRMQEQTEPLIVISYESSATIGIHMEAFVPGENIEGAVVVNEGSEEAFDEVALALAWEGVQAKR